MPPSGSRYAGAGSAGSDLTLHYRIARLAADGSEPGAALDFVLGELIKGFRADSGSLALVNPNTGLLETELAKGAAQPADSFALRPGQGVTGWVALHGRPLLVPDTAAEPRYIAVRPAVRCEMAAPLLDSEGRAVGVIDLESDTPRAFAPADLDRLAALADETSRVLHRLWQLHDHRARSAQLETLVTLGRSLVTRLTEEDLLGTLAHSGRTLFDAPLCTLHLHQDAVLQLKAWDAAAGFDPAALSRQPAPENASLLVAAVRANRVIEFQQLDGPGYLDALDLPRDRRLCSALAAPLPIDGVPAGVFTVFTTRPQRFSDAQRRLLAALANYAAVALQNARLYARVFRTEETLRKHETLTTLGLLAAEIAHEIRNPLTVIKLLHGTLGADFPAGDPRRRDIEVVAEKLEQLEGIVSRVLNFARTPGTLHSRWSLAEIVSDTLILLKAKLDQARVRVHCAFPPRPLLVDVNKGQLQQVLLNVILNSLHAMPAGGELTLRLATSPGANGGEAVLLDIEDTGTGIPPDIQPRIFESFLSGRIDGTGLGLAIARRILLDHHGAIALLSTGAAGTTMRITLPLAPS